MADISDNRYCGAIPPEPMSDVGSCLKPHGHAGGHKNMHGDEWEGDHWRERWAPTPIRIVESGGEQCEEHESWILVHANRISGGAHLFDSEIMHQHFVRVTIERVERRRDLNRDWLFAKKTLVEFDMSMSQWGAFVSSFGSSGVPATLTHFFADPEITSRVNTYGRVREAEHKPRLEESHREVKEAADKALEKIAEAYEAVEEAYERKAGRREMTPLLQTLRAHLRNAPANMKFAAESLTEHVENVVTKARDDIEAMAVRMQDAVPSDHLLGSGSDAEVLEIEESGEPHDTCSPAHCDENMPEECWAKGHDVEE